MKERSILQAKLTKLAIQIGYAGKSLFDKIVEKNVFFFKGMTIAILTVIVLLLRFSIEEFIQRYEVY